MARQLELTPRLQLLADWVPPGAHLADVGTDHAYLPVWLRLRGRVEHAIASDLRAMPLERARETGRTWGADGIEYRLCDGLSQIAPEEADVISVAGMGGETICAILSAAPWVKDGRHRLLLQPMTHAEDLRLYLMEQGFRILREGLVYDRGTIYPVMEASAGNMALGLGQLYGGAALTKDPLEDRYLIEKIVRLLGAVGGLARSSAPEDQEKADHLREIITALMSMREEWRRDNDS